MEDINKYAHLWEYFCDELFDNSLFDLGSVSDSLNSLTSCILQIIGSFYQNQAKRIPIDEWLKSSSEIQSLF